jgi:hypothetical protein
LRIVKRDDAKIEPEFVILSSDPDSHMDLLLVQIAVSSTYFFTFPNVDEGYARMIRNPVLRLQLSIIHLPRDETSEVYGKAVLSVKEIRCLFQMLDVENRFETRFLRAIRRELFGVSEETYFVELFGEFVKQMHKFENVDL